MSTLTGVFINTQNEHLLNIWSRFLRSNAVGSKLDEITNVCVLCVKQWTIFLINVLNKRFNTFCRC